MLRVHPPVPVPLCRDDVLVSVVVNVNSRRRASKLGYFQDARVIDVEKGRVFHTDNMLNHRLLFGNRSCKLTYVRHCSCIVDLSTRLTRVKLSFMAVCYNLCFV